MHWRPTVRACFVVSTISLCAAGQTKAPTDGASTEPQTTPAPSATKPSAPAESAQPESAEPTSGKAPTSAAGAVPQAPPAAAEAAPVPPSSDEVPGTDSAPEDSPPPAPPGPPPGPPPGAAPNEDYEEPEVPMTPPATDALGGHFLLGAGAAYLIPFGKYGSNFTQRSQTGPGLALAVDAGYGISRQLVLGLWGQWSTLSDGKKCSDCSTTAFAVGPFLRYHLVQGLRFDPWLAYGVAYRSVTVDQKDVELDFSGIDWARLQVGGDWYPARNFGLGPFLELVSGGYFDRPETAGAFRSYWQWSIGARLVLDVPGKLK